jgi:hypothetical protein
VRPALWWALCCATPGWAQPALDGGSGLLNVPHAEVLPDGAAAFQYSRIHPDLARELQAESWYAGVGFAPGLELGGRAITPALRVGRRDLSLDAKYRLPFDVGGVRFAFGAQDLGGAERLLPREYVVATWTAESLALTAGYGHGRNVLDGPFGGVEWRPWPWISAVVEHDAEDVNGGLKLAAPLWRGWRLGVTGAWRGALEETEYAINLTMPVGGDKPKPAPHPSPLPTRNDAWGEGKATPLAAQALASPHEVGRGRAAGAGEGPAALRAKLEDLGFEAVRIGHRAPATRVVRLENRRYNHSAADGLGLALGVIENLTGPDLRSIELYLFTYGVPQLRITRDAGHPARVEFVDGIADEAAVAWDGTATRASAFELVLEPLLRWGVATEHGLLDYGLGARARITVPLATGLLANIGVQAPLAHSDDFAPGRAFEDLAPRGGVDLALLQYLHTPAPGWSLLWSAGRTRIFRIDAQTVALDQAWSPGDGRHRFRARLMTVHSDVATREIALAGYNWLDARRAYGIGLTAGRFYLGDSGARLDVERHFGDTLVGLFWKFASPDDQAVGVTLSLPLTPRRDQRPRWLQIKGARRWAHGLGTTLNAPPNATSPNGTNPIRPLLLYEPLLDLDLERDIHDAGRLSAEYLDAHGPRMKQAWERWGD